MAERSFSMKSANYHYPCNRNFCGPCKVASYSGWVPIRNIKWMCGSSPQLTVIWPKKFAVGAFGPISIIA